MPTNMVYRRHRAVAYGLRWVVPDGNQSAHPSYPSFSAFDSNSRDFWFIGEQWRPSSSGPHDQSLFPPIILLLLLAHTYLDIYIDNRKYRETPADLMKVVIIILTDRLRPKLCPRDQ